MSDTVRNVLGITFGLVGAMLLLVGGVAWVTYAVRPECDNDYVWYHTGDFEGCITLDDAMRLQGEKP